MPNNIDNNQNNNSYSSMEYSGSGTPYEGAVNPPIIADEREASISRPEEEVRGSKLSKMLSEYKAIFVSDTMKADFDDYLADITNQLDQTQNTKTQRFNHPRLSFFEIFKTNKVHPELSPEQMKPLPVERVAEFTLAKEILETIKSYIYSHNSLDTIIKAMGNVGREHNEPVVSTNDPRDDYISLPDIIDELKKGSFDFSKIDGTKGNEKLKIKDESILKILKETSYELGTYDNNIRNFYRVTSTRVDEAVKVEVNSAYGNFIKTHPKAGFSRFTQDDKLNLLLKHLEPNEFSDMFTNIKNSLISYSTENVKTNTNAPGRRNAW